MPEESKDEPRPTQAEREDRDMRVKSALAMELPFTIVGSIVIGGFIGYLLDRWWHAWPWLTVVGGAFGFAGSMFEIARRFRPR